MAFQIVIKDAFQNTKYKKDSETLKKHIAEHDYFNASYLLPEHHLEMKAYFFCKNLNSYSNNFYNLFLRNQMVWMNEVPL